MHVRQHDFPGNRAPRNAEPICDLLSGHLAEPSRKKDRPASLRKLRDDVSEGIQIGLRQEHLFRCRCLIAHVQSRIDVERIPMTSFPPATVFRDVQNNAEKVAV